MRGLGPRLQLVLIVITDCAVVSRVLRFAVTPEVVFVLLWDWALLSDFYLPVALCTIRPPVLPACGTFCIFLDRSGHVHCVLVVPAERLPGTTLAIGCGMFDVEPGASTDVLLLGTHQVSTVAAKSRVRRCRGTTAGASLLEQRLFG